MLNILFTRSSKQNKSDIQLFCQKAKSKQLIEKYNCLNIPLIKTRGKQDIKIPDLLQLDWIFFTSAATVEYFFEVLSKNEQSQLKNIKYAAIGEKTAKRIFEKTKKKSWIPSVNNSLVFINEWENKFGEYKQNIFLPKSDLAKSQIEVLLSEHGHHIISEVLYENYLPPKSEVQIIDALQNGIDIIIVTSPSIWHRFYEVWRRYENVNIPIFYAIGPITATVIKESGYIAKTIKNQHTTIDNLLNKIICDIKKLE